MDVRIGKMMRADRCRYIGMKALTGRILQVRPRRPIINHQFFNHFSVSAKAFRRTLRHFSKGKVPHKGSRQIFQKRVRALKSGASCSSCWRVIQKLTNWLASCPVSAALRTALRTSTRRVKARVKGSSSFRVPIFPFNQTKC